MQLTKEEQHEQFRRLSDSELKFLRNFHYTFASGVTISPGPDNDGVKDFMIEFRSELRRKEFFIALAEILKASRKTRQKTVADNHKDNPFVRKIIYFLLDIIDDAQTITQPDVCSVVFTLKYHDDIEEIMRYVMFLNDLSSTLRVTATS